MKPFKRLNLSVDLTGGGNVSLSDYGLSVRHHCKTLEEFVKFASIGENLLEVKRPGSEVGETFCVCDVVFSEGLKVGVFSPLNEPATLKEVEECLTQRTNSLTTSGA